jgi:predicted HTH transcriptional regulator
MCQHLAINWRLIGDFRIVLYSNRRRNERQTRAIGYLGRKKLNERQRELIEVVKKKGEVVLSDYKKLFPDFAERTLRKDLEDLIKHGVLTPMGERKGRRYIFNGNVGTISAQYRQRAKG